MARDFDYIERIDRLTTIAESRRNASLREIDRRRAALAQTPRPIVEHIKEEVVDTESACSQTPGDQRAKSGPIARTRGPAVARKPPPVARARRNRLRHALSLPVSSMLSEEVQRLPRNSGPRPTPKSKNAHAGRRAQIDMRRVRCAPSIFAMRGRTPLRLEQHREKFKVIRLLTRKLEKFRRAHGSTNSTPEGPAKLATILSEETKRLVTMDRYERRALSRANLPFGPLTKRGGVQADCMNEFQL